MWGMGFWSGGAIYSSVPDKREIGTEVGDVAHVCNGNHWLGYPFEH